MSDETKPTRFAIGFSVFAALSNAFLLLPFSIIGLRKGISTHNTLLMAGSVFMIAFTAYDAVRHMLTLKKHGTKGWVDVNTRLRKV